MDINPQNPNKTLARKTQHHVKRITCPDQRGLLLESKTVTFFLII